MRQRRLTDDASRQTSSLVPRDPSVGRLTPTERAVALHVAEGLKNREIAMCLGMGVATVSLYVRRIRLRLDLASREDIATWVKVRQVPGDPEGRLCRADDSRAAVSSVAGMVRAPRPRAEAASLVPADESLPLPRLPSLHA